MTYTTTLSIFFLLAAVTAAYNAGRITPRSHRTSVFAIYGNARVVRAALWIFAALCVAGNIVGIGTLPTL